MSKKEKKQRQPKPKKEKIVWIDDGSTIADMSGVGGKRRKQGNPHHAPRGNTKGKPMTRRREIANTYMDACRMMFMPMMVTLFIIAVAFLLLWLSLGLLE